MVSCVASKELAIKLQYNTIKLNNAYLTKYSISIEWLNYTLNKTKRRSIFAKTNTQYTIHISKSFYKINENDNKLACIKP